MRRKILNPDGSLVGERTMSHLSIELIKSVEIRAGTSGSPDSERVSFNLRMDIDWQTTSRVGLSLNYAPSTCSAH